MAIAITATEDSAWPSRITVSATGLTIGHVVTLYRVQAGVRTAVRSATDVTLTDTSIVRVDAEQPYGVSLTYEVWQDGALGATSAAVTATLAGGNVALSDPVGALSVECLIGAWATKSADRQGTVFQVGGRTVGVYSPRGGSQADVEMVTLTDAARTDMLALLDGTTSGIVLMRQAGGYVGVDGVYLIESDDETRFSQDATDDRRLWSLRLAETVAWADSLPAQGWTYAEMTAAYTGLHYSNLASDFATYLAVAVFDWGSV